MDEATPGKITVALSGGGIRSATFSLGMLQALAQHRLLGRIGTLSTVSGGGYIGAFLCRLAAQIKGLDANATAAQAWDRTEQVLLAPTSSQVELAPAAGPVFHPLQWLRENSRYLTPSGSDDLVNGLAYYLRGLLGLHFNLAVLLLFLGLVNAGIGILGDRAWQALGAPQDTVRQWLWQPSAPKPPACPQPPAAAAGPCDFAWVPSGWWLAAAAAVAIAFAVGIAYWLTSRRTRAVDDKSRAARDEKIEGWMGFAAAAGLLATFIAWAIVANGVSPTQFAVASCLAVVCLMALAIGIASALGTAPPQEAQRSELEAAQIRTDVQRRRLTWLLGGTMKVAIAIAAIAAIDTLAMTLVRHHATHDSWLPWTLPVAVYGTVLAAAWKWLTQAEPVDGKPPRWAGLTQALLLLVALALLAGLALMYQVAAYALVFDAASLAALRDPLQAGLLPGALMAGGLLLVAACVHYTPGFLNLSSFHNLYTARLKRAYLGAANPKRLHAMASSGRGAHREKRKAFVNEVVPGDEPAAIADYLAANAALGIEHIVNVTLNQRVSPTSPTLAQDRQGVPVCLAAGGMLVNPPHQGDVKPRFTLETMKESPLTLGQWISISGAAFSVGVGKETKPGYALLSFLANVRTAYWWRVPDATTARKHVEGTWDYLLEEARCRFRGIAGRYWYLSDGGHFDNTAVYELLRRRTPVVLASDNGADPCYRFDDLMHLLRRARIDFGAEAVVRSAAELDAIGPGLAGFGTPEQFRRAKDAREPMPHALWVEVYYDRGRGHRPRDPASERPDTVVIFIKPALADALAGDVSHYAGAHPAFPQETTADQFFDEAQWESYRALGQALAARVLKQDVFAAAAARVAPAHLP